MSQGSSFGPRGPKKRNKIKLSDIKQTAEF